MHLPTTLAPPPIVPEPLILGVSASKNVDKFIIDKALTLKTLDSIDIFFARLSELALSSDSDSVSLDAIKYLLDRAAGKSAQQVAHSGAIAHVLVSADDVRERLAHLKSAYAEES